jgi:SAM-dependent methyltransferase
MQTDQFQLHADIEQDHWWFVARRRIVRQLIGEILPPAADALIIDVGCGTGGNIADLADDYTCLGIDTSAEAVALAERRFPQVQFVCGSAPQDLGAKIEQAKLVLLMDVLEHVPDDFAVLSALLAAARPGTHFLLTVPADYSLWSEHDRSFGHYRRYDRQRLEMVWAGLPVTPRLVSYFNSRLYWLIRLIRERNRLRGEAAGRAGTDFWMPRPSLNRMLQSIFAGESRRLSGLLAGRYRRGYRRGASLLALLRREAGELPIRQKPPSLPADRGTGTGGE